jgi:pyruvate dehydrogenase E1 component alpha subunit
MAPKILTRKDELHLLKQMLQIRSFEDKVFELLARDLLKGASHAYVGEEAIAVGACAAIGPEDYITSTHRGHGHCLARGADLKLMMAELCGKATGYCRGRGGSMHIADVKAGNLGATGIVGSNIPVATGAGLAIKIQKKESICLCFFGDGAANTGAFHESLNLAGLWKLPVVYICENNLYGMSVSVERASAVENIAERASAYNMPGEIVDGMKVLDVYEAVRKAADRARAGEGPTLLECKAYRYRGHSRSDSRKYRTKEEEDHWLARDPIDQFKKHLSEEGALSDEDFAALEREVAEEIAAAEHFALEESPYPSPDDLYDDVYVNYVQTEKGLARKN